MLKMRHSVVRKQTTAFQTLKFKAQTIRIGSTADGVLGKNFQSKITSVLQNL